MAWLWDCEPFHLRTLTPGDGMAVTFDTGSNAACMMYSPPEVPKMVAITIRRNLTARQSRIA